MEMEPRLEPLPDIANLSADKLRTLLLKVYAVATELAKGYALQREEIARLKNLPKRPKFKSSGLEKRAEAAKKKGTPPRRRGKTRPNLKIDEVRIIKMPRPPGAVSHGYTSFVVQDLTIRTNVIEFQCEQWLLPDKKTVVTAPLPEGFEGEGHFGPEVRRTILAHYHKAQTTSPRLLEFLQMYGIDISKRQVTRILIDDNEPFIKECNEVLRAALSSCAWITVDDTGAVHKAKNGYTTQIGNAHFTWFRTTESKSRTNFLSLLRTGYSDYVITDDALAYMRDQKLANYLINSLADHPDKYFADLESWNAHLAKVGIISRKVSAKSAEIATQGAIWGSVRHHNLLNDSVIISDDAGQFNVGNHALCWVHCERLIHKLDAFTEAHRKLKARIEDRIWKFFFDLKAYQLAPTPRHKAKLAAWFERIFTTKTGFAALDEQLERIYKNKEELLKVLDHPKIPLHTNSSENDIRTIVTRRRISGGTRSDDGRTSRDTFLSLMKTCMKLGISFYDYLGARLKVPGAPDVPWLPDLVRHRCQSG
ncbi:MAG: transposase [Alphaproteobacteria bacterium]|nr:transposase [Alphaproteobacteria bacterium]